MTFLKYDEVVKIHVFWYFFKVPLAPLGYLI